MNNPLNAFFGDEPVEGGQCMFCDRIIEKGNDDYLCRRCLSELDTRTNMAKWAITFAIIAVLIIIFVSI